MTGRIRIHAVSALLRNAEGRVLAQLRDDRPGLIFPGCWSTLGGRVEPDELPEQAVCRELQEEIEVCPPLRYWRRFLLEYEADGRAMESDVHVFIGEFDQDAADIRLHEGQRVAFLGVEDINRLPFAFALDQIFRAYFETFGGDVAAVPDDRRIVLAADDEAELVHYIMREAFAEYAEVLQPPSGATRETVDDVRQAMRRGGAVLVWEGDRAVASARFRLDTDALYVGRVAVLPQHRRRGIGRRIMTFMEALALERGYRSVRLGVRMQLPGNLAFYQKLGYEIMHVVPHERGNDQIAFLAKQIGDDPFEEPR